MFSASAELYDVIYAFKDYSSEAAQLDALIQRERPGAHSLLDVACGTGEHARHLAEIRDYKISGLDIEQHFVQLAQAKVPAARFIVADMVDFELNEHFDAILCLFSAIGYVKTLSNVRRVLQRFSQHLNPDGIVLLEPWFAPDQWRPGTISVISAERDDTRVVRMSSSAVEGRMSHIEFHYLIGEPSGIEHRRELHELGLFTTAELLQCFSEAGLEASFSDEGPAGRGIYIAHIAGT